MSQGESQVPPGQPRSSRQPRPHPETGQEESTQPRRASQPEQPQGEAAQPPSESQSTPQMHPRKTRGPTKRLPQPAHKHQTRTPKHRPHKGRRPRFEESARIHPTSMSPALRPHLRHPAASHPPSHSKPQQQGSSPARYHPSTIRNCNQAGTTEPRNHAEPPPKYKDRTDPAVKHPRKSPGTATTKPSPTTALRPTKAPAALDPKKDATPPQLLQSSLAHPTSKANIPPMARPAGQENMEPAKPPGPRRQPQAAHETTHEPAPARDPHPSPPTDPDQVQPASHPATSQDAHHRPIRPTTTTNQPQARGQSSRKKQ
ncbi:extensin-like [Kryptolebias marmoratus]|uniref:extensin-like n=1 Tax=Kryptolebias marmoratus TaxID=37003 RepID=UPI0007F8B6E8|nr:extensin-like [Kryptolebias marmoratus]